MIEASPPVYVRYENSASTALSHFDPYRGARSPMSRGDPSSQCSAERPSTWVLVVASAIVPQLMRYSFDINIFVLELLLRMHRARFLIGASAGGTVEPLHCAVDLILDYNHGFQTA